jgi:hypothetical protein
MTKRALLCSAIAALCWVAGCSHFQVGDSTMTVRGQLAGPSPAGAECRLELIAVGSEELLDSRNITGAFEVTFLIGPGRKNYYLEIHCESVQGAYRSEDFVVEGMSAFRVPIDLGVIEPESFSGSD